METTLLSLLGFLCFLFTGPGTRLGVPDPRHRSWWGDRAGTFLSGEDRTLGQRGTVSTLDKQCSPSTRSVLVLPLRERPEDVDKVKWGLFGSVLGRAFSTVTTEDGLFVPLEPEGRVPNITTILMTFVFSVK